MDGTKLQANTATNNITAKAKCASRFKMFSSKNGGKIKAALSLYS
jgi:hypothetical protein